MDQDKERVESLGSPGPTIFMHIGTPKSGTTYLQSRMVANHEQARQQGLLRPGPAWGMHVEAVGDLRRLKPGKQLAPDGPWLRLAREVREWSGSRVLISMEWLVWCRPHQISAAIASLQPGQVEVICTARDLMRTFVTQWQEMTKNSRPWSWEQFVEEMLEDRPGPAHEAFWSQQDVPGILKRWAGFVSPDRIHLVTVPPGTSDPELLWQRFCSVIDLDGRSFQSPRRTNESLGVVSTVLMQRVNVAAVDQGVTYTEYKRVFHNKLASRILAGRRASEQPMAVSSEVDTWTRMRAERIVKDLGRLDVNVVGRVEDLLPGSPLEGREPDDVDDAELLDTCIDALVSLGVSQFQALQRAQTSNQNQRRQLVSLRARHRALARQLEAGGRAPRLRGLVGHGKAFVKRSLHRARGVGAR